MCGIPNWTPLETSCHDPAISPGVPLTGGGIAVAAVVAELRKGLRVHDIRAGEVRGRASADPPTVDLSDIPLGDAAVLAYVLNASASEPRPRPTDG